MGPGICLLFALIVLGFTLAPRACGQLPVYEPEAVGYVTSVAADGGFDVHARHVVVTAGTRVFRQDGKAKVPIAKLETPFVGEQMQIWGNFDRRSRTLTATHVIATPPAVAGVRGSGMVDLQIASGAEEPVLRADGYVLRFTRDTKIFYNDPLSGLKDLTTNIWIEYKGIQQLDGSVTVAAAEVWPNTVPTDEEHLREKREFDPASVGQANKQSDTNAFFHGRDPRKLPAHKDVALQARVERIGQSLVPDYQQALPPGDRTRIHFRFQVVDSDYYRESIAFANGIVLLPWPAAGRLQNDAQVAAVLADAIAVVIEKQEILHQPVHNALMAVRSVGEAAAFVVPAVGIPAHFAAGQAEEHAGTMHRQQSSRVALCLLHDAGYDLVQAPVAWRLLDAKKPKPLEDADFPDRSDFLYFWLGTTWHGAGEPKASP